MQLWGNENCALITQILKHPSGLKVLNAIYGGGDMDDLLEEIMPSVMDYAKQIGCEKVTLEGRKGWERVFKNAKVESVILSLKVN